MGRQLRLWFAMLSDDTGGVDGSMGAGQDLCSFFLCFCTIQKATALMMLGSWPYTKRDSLATSCCYIREFAESPDAVIIK